MQSFVVWNDEINERLDAGYYYSLQDIIYTKIKNSKYPIRKMRELASIVTKGESPLWKGDSFLKEGIPFLRGKNIKEGAINFEDVVYISDSVHRRMRRSILSGNYLLLTMAGTLGDVAFFKEEYPECNINQDIAKIKLTDAILYEYATVYFQTALAKKQINILSNGGTRSHLNFEQIKSFDVILPPISVQTKIVEIMQSAYNQKKQKEAEAQRLLDSIDDYVLDELGIKLPEIKTKRCFLVWNNEVVQRLDPLYYSKDVFSFLKKFSYDVKPLEGITYYLKTGFAAGNSQQEAVNEGIIQIRPTNIDDIGLLRFDKNIYLKKEYLDKKNADLLQKGEVLFNNTNSQELVGKTSFFDLEGQYFCSNHITRIKVNEDFVSPTYLWIILNIYQKAKVFFNLCTNWNNQSGVNIELLKTVQIPLPPLAIQHKIADEVKKRISEAERLKAEAGKVI